MSEALSERRETPDPQDITSGLVKIVSKIGFADGQIQLRSTTTTQTKMILAHPGDLLVSGINAAKGAVAVYDEFASRSIAATIHYGAYVPNPNISDARFLWYLMRSNIFRSILETHVPGGIKTELKAKRLLSVPIPLPPLSEQQRIVAEIEAYSLVVESAKTVREDVLAKTVALRTSILRDRLPEHATGKLGDVLTGRPRNGWSARCDNSDGGTPVLSLSAVTGFRYQSSAFKKTSEETKDHAHYWLREGDLLVTRSNSPELVGHAAIYNGRPSPCIYPDLMMRLEVDKTRATVPFVHLWLQSPIVRNFIRNSAKGTSPTMKKITQAVVMDVPFPTGLSIDRQNSLVEEIGEIQNQIDGMNHLQSEVTKMIDALLPAMLNQVFQGNL